MNIQNADTASRINLTSFKLPAGGLFSAFPFYFNKKPVPSVWCAVSLRKAGDMGFTDDPLTKNRRLLLAEAGIDTRRLFSCRQSHSQDVVCVQEAEPVVDADGLAGGVGAVLSVTVADCLPVFLYDTKNQVFALCHSGWKGTGIAVNALSLMSKEFGTQAEDTAAVLGPCIRSSCYNTDEERAMRYNELFGMKKGFYPLGKPVREEAGTDGARSFFLDMQAANAKLLFDYGVTNIAYCTNSTFTDTSLGSFRREGSNFTKMMAFSAGSLTNTFIPAW